jgi:hypothetical protein
VGPSGDRFLFFRASHKSLIPDFIPPEPIRFIRPEFAPNQDVREVKKEKRISWLNRSLAAQSRPDSAESALVIHQLGPQIGGRLEISFLFVPAEHSIAAVLATKH